MPTTPSVMSLHLRYRLWIAEMNLDINVLRIFNDYMEDLSPKINEPEVKSGIDNFAREFSILRKEIDELRNEMHLLKMKLAGYSREKKLIDYDTYKTDKHPALKKRYLAFRTTFENVKKSFGAFELKWLN